MLRWIVGSSLKFRFIVIAFAVGMIYFGVRQMSQAPVDVFPEFAPPRVEIQTPCLGLSPDEVEALVTIPLEQALNGVAGLDIMRSKSVPQLSSVLLIFKPDTDLLIARQLVRERITQIRNTLPTWAAPPIMLQPLSATSRTMKIGISSKELSVMDLSMITYWTIRPRLLAVPGVANVAIWGERLKMLTMQIEPERLREHGVTLDETMESATEALRTGLLQYAEGSWIGTGGFIEDGDQRLQIRHVQPVATPTDLEKIVIKEENGQQVYISDVAKIVEDHQAMIGDGIVNDDIGLLLIVEKFPWGNTLEVTKGVEEALSALKPGLPGVDIDHEIFRPATFIEMSIDNLTTALLIGCLLVVLILFAFLYEWRTALISITAIPLSLIAAGLVLFLRDATINTMILAGFVIALGAVVDDAIVDVENIVRRLREHRKQGGKTSIAKIILEASFEVRHAIIFSTLIEIIALAPIFFMEGLSGAFFKPLALSYALAVVASTVVALTVTPAMSYILLRNAPLEKRESPLVKFLHRGYDRILGHIMRTPIPAYATVGVIALIGVLITPRLGQELLPSFKERDFLTNIFPAMRAPSALMLRKLPARSSS